MKVKIQQPLVLVSALGLALSGCSANGANPQSVPNVAPVAQNVLQFAVGTANLYGTSTALNVVATYRQPSNSQFPGRSGALTSSVTLTVPGTLPGTAGGPTGFDPLSTVESGPGTTDAGASVMTSTSQNPGASAVTTFGQSGSVFANGIEPFNANGTSGKPFQVAPYPVPLFDAIIMAATMTTPAVTDPNAFVPWGGQPAYNPVNSGGVSVVGNGNFPSGTAGVPLGIDVFAGVAPTAGSYGLSVSLPANTGTVTANASATMPAAPVMLGNATASAYTPDGNGGGTLAFTMQTGATEALVQVTDFGPVEPAPPAMGAAPPVPTASCNGSAAGSPFYYTIEATASGTLTLPDAIGPGGAPSICTEAMNVAANAMASPPPSVAVTGDQFVVQVIGFDYPFFESSLPNSLGNPSPTITGANGSDDLTISAAVCNNEPAGGGALV